MHPSSLYLHIYIYSRSPSVFKLIQHSRLMNETIECLVLAKGNVEHLSGALTQAWAAPLTNNRLVKSQRDLERRLPCSNWQSIRSLNAALVRCWRCNTDKKLQCYTHQSIQSILFFSFHLMYSKMVQCNSTQVTKPFLDTFISTDCVLSSDHVKTNKQTKGIH